MGRRRGSDLWLSCLWAGCAGAGSRLWELRLLGGGESRNVGRKLELPWEGGGQLPPRPEDDMPRFDGRKTLPPIVDGRRLPKARAGQRESADWPAPGPPYRPRGIWVAKISDGEDGKMDDGRMANDGQLNPIMTSG